MNLEQYIAAMDPELRPVFMQRAASVQQLIADPTQAQGQTVAAPVSAPASTQRVTVVDRSIPGPAGAPEVPVRTYTPAGTNGTLPAVLWIHGGGFTAGSPAQNDDFCLRVVEEVRCVVVSVDYRLAPAHPFPAALDDCYVALRWLATPDSGLEIDPGRIAVGGSSAGGNLAAAVTLMARDRGEVALAFQLLVYPCLDDRHTTPSSHEMAAEGMIWNRAQSLRGWQLYLGNDGNKENGQTSDVSSYAAPARMANLDGLPPTYVMAAQLDLLRDEDIEYAMRLMQAGVPTELQVHPGAMHGFVLFAASAPVSERAISGYVTALRRALNP